MAPAPAEESESIEEVSRTSSEHGKGLSEVLFKHINMHIRDIRNAYEWVRDHLRSMAEDKMQCLFRKYRDPDGQLDPMAMLWDTLTPLARSYLHELEIRNGEPSGQHLEPHGTCRELYSWPNTNRDAISRHNIFDTQEQIDSPMETRGR